MARKADPAPAAPAPHPLPSRGGAYLVDAAGNLIPDVAAEAEPPRDATVQAPVQRPIEEGH